MTNITWVIDGKQLQQQFNFKTAVLNDFEAVGYGIPALAAKDLVALNDVPIQPKAPKVVMGPGRCFCCQRNKQVRVKGYVPQIPKPFHICCTVFEL